MYGFEAKVVVTQQLVCVNFCGGHNCDIAVRSAENLICGPPHPNLKRQHSRM